MKVSNTSVGKFTPKKWHIVVAVVLVLIMIVSVCFAIFFSKRTKNVQGTMMQDAIVERRTIISSVTGTSVVMPKDQYSITSLVSGDVLSANFEQGDMVEKGDILYQIDSSDVESSIKSADLGVQRSTNNYNQAVEDQKDLTVKTDVAGVIKKLHIKKGDTVNAGAPIADIYDDTTLELTVPFNETDIPKLSVGAYASVSVSGTGDTVNGSVSEIKGTSYAKSGNMLVRDVVISVSNPGTLMTTDTAVATVLGIACNDAGTFTYITEKTVTAKASGDVSKLYVSEGERVSSGQTLVQLSSEAVSRNITSNSLSLKESTLSRDNAKKKLEDYTITAPISGTVIEKNIKAGDKLDNKTASTIMAVIYDMSALECELAVDELDIKNVSIGQSVTITSDALEHKIYHGEVTNISVNGTTENGVTTYPVTINILDFDEALLPGMNIDATIITAQTDHVLSVPVSAVQRGNIVYVKGEKTKEDDHAPDGYKSVTVETGVYNDTFIEILSGLSEGDSVWVPPVDTTSDLQKMMQGMSNPHGGMGGGMSGGMGGPPAGNAGGAPNGMR